MAIAIERPRVVARQAKRYRARRGVGHVLTYLGLAAALSYVIVGGVLALTLLFLWIQRIREVRAA